MSRISLALVLAIVSPQIGEGADEDIPKSVAKCAVIAGALERLQCFDDIADQFRLGAPQPVPVRVGEKGKWDVRHSMNPIDDTERVVIALTADQGRSRNGDRVMFVARCQSNKTEAFITWNDYLGDDSSDVYEDWKYVTIRIGNEEAQRQRWSISTDKTATFAPEWAGDLLQQMARSDAFVAQTTPYSENPITAIFDTTGMKNALAPLAQTCGWKVKE